MCKNGPGRERSYESPNHAANPLQDPLEILVALYRRIVEKFRSNSGN